MYTVKVHTKVLSQFLATNIKVIIVHVCYTTGYIYYTSCSDDITMGS